MIKVFHVKEQQLITDEQQMKQVIKDISNYECVAQVETSSAEEAKELTTHITCNWWDNDGVESDERIGLTRNARSTGPGDILVTEDQVLLITNSGFESLPEEDGKYYALKAETALDIQEQHYKLA